MASNFQRGYDDERFETNVNRNFHCLICFNVLRDPVMCRRNQHYFCRGCITEHLRRNSHTCPTCADELSVETLCDAPRIVEDYLNELNIRCDHYNRGCRELVQLQNLKYHVAECGFTPIVCGNQGCDETISKRDRTYHESELCEFRKLKCHNCGEISTKIAALITKIEHMDVNTEKNLADVHTKLAGMEANIDGRIANTDTEIGNVKTNLAEVKTKIESLDMRMANVQANMNNEVREMKMSLTEVKDVFNHLKEVVFGKIESKEGNQEEIARGVSGTANGSGEKQHIFVAGGVCRNSVEIFNYHQRLWSLLKPMPGGVRSRASSFVYNNKVTVAGGWYPDTVDNMIQMNIQPIPDLTINWSDIATKLPARLRGHSNVVYKDSLFVTGGFDADRKVNSDCINEVQLKPPHSVKLLCKMPQPRADHSTVLCDDSILIFGGDKAYHYKGNLSSVVSYDLKKNKCQQLPQLPYPVSEMAAVKWSENAVIIGGADKDGKALNTVIIYNIKTGNSHMLPPMSHKRKGCMAVVIQNTIVVLGGSDSRGKDLKSVEGFSFDRYTWEELPDMKEARCLATAVAI